MQIQGLNDPNLHALLQLTSVPRLGPRKIRTLVRRFKSPQNVLAASVRELVQNEGIDQTMARHIKVHSSAKFADHQLERAAKISAHIVTIWDDRYPFLLKKTYDPPVLLFTKGILHPEDHKGLAVVGTRQPTCYGNLITEKFCRQLGQHRITVVSGLARGIDTLAHRAALYGRGRTVAVLGSGVDYIYPHENRELAEKIIESGALLSEFSLGTKPEPHYFPRRNRIVAGICQATLVIEAGKKSGALITSDYALEQGRDVFAVPGPVNSSQSVGPNELIQQGAKPILTLEDILEEFGYNAKVENSQPDIQLDILEEKIFSFIRQEPVHIDNLLTESKMPPAQVHSILLSLELKSAIKQLPGKNFIRL